MAINYPPKIGTLLFCNFHGTVFPEMDKKRPVLVLASISNSLCIVVPLSTSPPLPQRAWHYQLHTPEPLPAPYDSEYHWIKGDMVGTVSFSRLSLPLRGKDKFGKRIYDIRIVADKDLQEVRRCVAAAVFPHGVDFLE